MFAFKRVRERCDALLSIGLEARDSGSLNLAASVFKELARYVYPQRKAVDPAAVGQPCVIQVVTGVPRSPDDPVEEGGSEIICVSFAEAPRQQEVGLFIKGERLIGALRAEVVSEEGWL
jgi:hypothetical protein